MRGTVLLFYQFAEDEGVVVHVAVGGVGWSDTRLGARGWGKYSLDHGDVP